MHERQIGRESIGVAVDTDVVIIPDLKPVVERRNRGTRSRLKLVAAAKSFSLQALGKRSVRPPRRGGIASVVSSVCDDALNERFTPPDSARLTEPFLGLQRLPSASRTRALTSCAHLSSLQQRGPFRAARASHSGHRGTAGDW